jgi:hypothetical protein
LILVWLLPAKAHWLQLLNYGCQWNIAAVVHCKQFTFIAQTGQLRFLSWAKISLSKNKSYTQKYSILSLPKLLDMGQALVQVYILDSPS